MKISRVSAMLHRKTGNCLSAFHKINKRGRGPVKVSHNTTHTVILAVAALCFALEQHSTSWQDFSQNDRTQATEKLALSIEMRKVPAGNMKFLVCYSAQNSFIFIELIHKKHKQLFTLELHFILKISWAHFPCLIWKLLTAACWRCAIRQCWWLNKPSLCSCCLAGELSVCANSV